VSPCPSCMFRPVQVNYQGGALSELMCLCIYLPDNELVEVDTCQRDISDKWLFIINCAIYWIAYCMAFKHLSHCYTKTCILGVFWGKYWNCTLKPVNTTSHNIFHTSPFTYIPLSILQTHGVEKLSLNKISKSLFWQFLSGKRYR